MTSTDAQDRDHRRAAHAQRVDAIRRQRAERRRPPRQSVTADADPFQVVGAEPYQEVFPL